MALDGMVVANLAYDLNKELSGTRISKIAQPETDELLLTLKGQNGQRRLLLSANASLPLVYLTEQNKPSPMTAPNFCMLLRKHIANGRILSVTQPSMERILVFEAEHLDDLGDLRTKKLIVELMGKHSNIIFTDDRDRILDSIKHISALVSSVREVLPGRTYFIPAQEGKKSPLDEDPDAFIKTVSHKPAAVSKAVYSSYTGISPLMANELCYRAGIDGHAPCASVSETQWSKLASSFCTVMTQIREGRFEPHIYRKGEEPVEFSPFPLFSYADCSGTPCASISAVLEGFYAEKNAYTRIRQKSADLRHVVSTHLERNRKKYDLQARQLKDTEKREKYRIYGELIHTYGYQVPEGTRSFEALNYYTDEMIRIPLDPDLTPQENAKKYFDRYGKLKRTYEALSDLIGDTRMEIEHLDSIAAALDIAGSEADLAQIREEMVQSGYIRRKSDRKKQQQPKSRPWHYRSTDGFDMYVGKNNLQNDELTFRFSEGNDWWFHAKQMPGSHVLVKTKTGELPDRTFEEAAALAAYYSRGRGSEKVEIDYLQKKNVKKPNKSKPGFVVYYTNYSMVGTPDISGIELISE
ncbi:MAG: NFACT family protein [Lachnospiraceae bacterium]|nr:NFACT family protein [Lachnospiraceae bacterium]